MPKFRHRNALAFSAIILATALGLIGCSSPSPTTSDGAAGGTPVESTDDAAPGGEAVGCPAEMDAVVSAGGQVEAEPVSRADYFVPGLDDALLAEACIYETASQGKTAQWAWFRGEDAAVVATAITEALAAAGYTLEDEVDGSQLYTSASAPSLTLVAIATADEAAAVDSELIFDLLGPYVSVFQYYS